MSDKDKQVIIKNILLLLGIILISVLLVRGLTSGETLSEYAEENKFPIHSTQ